MAKKTKTEQRKPHSVIQLRISLPLRKAVDEHVAAYNKARPLDRPLTLTSFIAQSLAHAVTHEDPKQTKLRAVK